MATEKIWEDTKKEDVFSKYLNAEEDTPRFNILKLDTQFPVLVTEEGHIVCIETNKKDQLRIGNFGSSRSGKTINLNRLFNRYYWIGGRRSLWLNDTVDDTFHHQEPMRSPQMVKMLNAIGEKPCYTPFVHLFPHTVGGVALKHQPSISAEICFELSKSLDQPKLFFNLDRSANYLNKLKQELIYARTREEVNSLFETIRIKTSAIKIHDKFSFYFDEEIFDITAPGKIFCKGVLEDKKTGTRKHYPIIPALMCMDTCVSLHTKGIVDKEYLPAISALELNDLIKLYTEDKFFSSIPAHIAIDELHKISSNKILNEAIQNIAKLGVLNIGVSYANQSYSNVDSHLKGNTRLAFCFGFKRREEAKELVGNFSAESTYVDQLLSLDRAKHECVLFIDDEVIVYDVENNNKYKVTNGAIRGIAIPPPSNNKQPDEMLNLSPILK